MFLDLFHGMLQFSDAKYFVQIYGDKRSNMTHIFCCRLPILRLDKISEKLAVDSPCKMN